MELLIGCGSTRDKRITMPPEIPTEWVQLKTLDIVISHNPNYLVDLNKPPYGLGSNEWNEIHGYEVLEHLGQQGDYKSFFAQFNEFHRLLKPNGYFCATVPSRHSPWAWGDPGHTRLITRETLVFLCQEAYREQVGITAMSDYRDVYTGDFKIIYADDNGQTFTFILQALK